MVEIIATLVIIGILAATATPRFINMASEAKKKAALAGIAEYNGREKNQWWRLHITDDFTSLSDTELDQTLYEQMDFDLNSGDETDWTYTEGSGSAGNIRTATLQFKGENLAISRTPATSDTPARWGLSAETTTSGSFANASFKDLNNSQNWTVSTDGSLSITGASSLLLEGSTSDVVDEAFTATLTDGRGFGFYYMATETSVYPKVAGYTFQVDPGAGDAFLIKDAATDKNIQYVDDDGNTQTARVKASDIFGSDFDINAEHTYSVEVVGTQQTIKVDGVTVFSFSDDTYTSGQTGFRTWSGDTSVTIK